MEKTQTRKKTLILVVLIAVLALLSSFMVGCTQDPPSVPSVTLSATTIALDVQDTYTLTATKENTDAQIVWSSSDTSVATVTDGVVRALAEGSATITASAGGASAQCTVTVTDSHTIPVLVVDSEIAVGKGSSYPLSVETRWKGEPIDEAVEYTWVADEATAANIATISTNENGSVATFTGVEYGSTSYTVSATVRGTLLTSTVVVSVRNTALRFEIEGLTLADDAYVANVALKDTTTGDSKTLDMGLTVYNDDVPVTDPAITYTYYDNGSTNGSATSEIISISGSNIEALKAGSTEVHGTYEGNDFRLRITTYRPEIEIEVSDNGNDYLTIETAAGAGETLTTSLTVNEIGSGETVETLLVNGFDAYESHTAEDNEYTITLNRSELPKKGEDLGMKTVTVVTDKAEYVAKAFLATLIINDADELDGFDEIAAEIAGSTITWDGYYALGNDIDYNKSFPVFHFWGESNALVEQDWNNGNVYGFRGVFDGRGYNIDGLTMAQDGGAFIGLLHRDGVLKNVSFTNAKVTAKGSLLVHSGSGTVENVYVHCAEQIAGGLTNMWRSGFIFSAGLTNTARVRNVFIDTAVLADSANAYTIGGNLDNSGVYNNVYAVGATAAMVSYAKEETGTDVYGSYKNYSELLNASIDFTSWQNDFWALIGGLPYPKNLPAPGVQDANSLITNDVVVEYTIPGSEIELSLKDSKTVAAVSGADVTLTVDANSISIDVPSTVASNTVVTLTVKNAYNSNVSKTFTFTVVGGETVNLDDVSGFTKPVIEAGRMIDSNRAIKTDAYFEFDMSGANSVFDGNVDAYEAIAFTVDGVIVGGEDSGHEGGVFKYAPGLLIEALRKLSVGYGDNRTAEILFVKNDNSKMITAQFSVDVLGLLIKNADDLDHMMTAAQGLSYYEYYNYGGFNGAEVGSGNALGIYRLANDIDYKAGNADRQYSSQYFSRVKPFSNYNLPKYFPADMKNGQQGGFLGTFDGCGYTISNLEFAENSTGLVGYIGETGVIKNVSFVNLVHTGWYGAIAAFQYKGTIDDVYMNISMTAKPYDTLPSNKLLPEMTDGYATMTEAVGDDMQKEWSQSAALVSKNFEIHNCNRVFVEYKSFTSDSADIWDRVGYPYAHLTIRTDPTGLNDLIAIGTLANPTTLAAEGYMNNSGLWATVNDLQDANKDFSTWDNDFWKLVDGVPVPEKLPAQQVNINSFEKTGENTFEIDAPVLYRTITVDDASATVNGNVITFPSGVPDTFTVTVSSLVSEEDKTVIVQSVNLDGVITKPVIEAGRMIDSNRAIKTDAYFEFDMSGAESVFGGNVGDYDAKKLTIDGVTVGGEDSGYDEGKIKYAPNLLIDALRKLSVGYGDNKTAEILFVKKDGSKMITAQFSVDVLGLLIKNADDLDHMMTAAQGLSYYEYYNYGGFNGAEVGSGNALGIYRLANDIDYKAGNADRQYSSQYFSRVKPYSNYNLPKYFPADMKNGQQGGFLGTFDGCGYTIKGLEFAENSTGLVGYIGETGVIKNVSFVNLVHTGWYGAIAAFQYKGTLDDIYMEISMTAKPYNTLPTTRLLPKMADGYYPNMTEDASEAMEKEWSQSAALVSKNFEIHNCNRVFVEYKSFTSDSADIWDRVGYPYANLTIRTDPTGLNDLIAIGTLANPTTLAAEGYMNNSGLWATVNDLQDANKDFSTWDNDFWKLVDGIPVPEKLAAQQAKINDITKTGENTFEIDVNEVLYRTITVDDASATVNGNVITFPNGVPDTFTVTVKSLTSDEVKTVTVTDLDGVSGFTKPVIEAGRMIDSNRAIKTDAYFEFDMSGAESVFGGNADAYDAKKLTIDGVTVGGEDSGHEGGVFKYAPGLLIDALKHLTVSYGDNRTAEITFVNNDNSKMIKAQFSVDVLGLLIKNADDLDHMMTAAQGLSYYEYYNYGGFNGAEVGSGNALGIYRLANDIDYKAGNADRQYSSQYFSRVEPYSNYNLYKYFPADMKNGQQGGFLGTFDGCGYTISNLEFAENSTGLVGYIGETGVIKNVSFVNLVHTGWYGAIAAFQYKGTLDDIYMEISMTAKPYSELPDTRLLPVTTDGYANMTEVVGDDMQQEWSQSAALVSKNFEIHNCNRVFVKYKSFTSYDFYKRVGYPYAHLTIRTDPTGLNDLIAIGTLANNTLAAEGYMNNSGLWATVNDLQAANKDFSTWDNDFWKLVDGIPVPEKLAAQQAKINDITKTGENTFEIDADAVLYRTITVDDASATVSGNVITFPNGVPDTFTVTVKSLTSDEVKTVTFIDKIAVADTTQSHRSTTIDVDLWAATKSDDSNYNNYQSFYVDLTGVNVNSFKTVTLGNRTLSTDDYTYKKGDQITIDKAQYTGDNALYGEQTLSLSTRETDSDGSLTVVADVKATIVFADKIIRNVGELARSTSKGGTDGFAKYLRRTTDGKYSDGYVILYADVDASGQNLGLWVDNGSYEFRGTFDGRNHVISNWTITNGQWDKAAFLTATYQATVKNLTFLNVNNTGNCGVVSTYPEYSTFENITVYGKMEPAYGDSNATTTSLCASSAQNCEFKNIIVVCETFNTKFSTTNKLSGALIANYNTTNSSQYSTAENCIAINLYDSNVKDDWAMPAFITHKDQYGSDTYSRTAYDQEGWGRASGTGYSDTVQQFHGWDEYAAWAKTQTDETLAAYFGTNNVGVEVGGVKYPVAKGIDLTTENANATALKTNAFSDKKTTTDTASAGSYAFTTSGYYKTYSVDKVASAEEGWSLGYNTVTVPSGGDSFVITVKSLLGGTDLTRTVTVS